MQNKFRLSHYVPIKKLRLVIDRLKTVGTEFFLIQYINDRKPEKGINIIHSCSGLLSNDKYFSPVEAEAIALDWVMAACHNWI